MTFFSSFGSLGNQQNFEVFFAPPKPVARVFKFFLRIGAHLGIFFIGENSPALGNAAFQVLKFAIFFDNV